MDAEKLISLERGLRTIFMKAFGNGESPADVSPFIMDSPSDGADEKYGWLGQSPSMRKWVDERLIKGLLEFDYTIKNERYEATLGFQRTDLADDRYGQLSVRIRDLAAKARIHPRKLFFDALVAGTTGICYDGQAFFSAAHKYQVGGKTQSNLQVGTGTSLEQIMSDFGSGRTALRGLLDDQGEPWNEGGEMALTIIAPNALEGKLERIFTADLLGNNTNTLKGKAKFMTTGRLTDDNDWYLINTGGSLKPFVRQPRQNARFSALEGGSERGFLRDEFLYGVDYRIGFGYGLWERAVKITNT